jgi:hypothetical protein
MVRRTIALQLKNSFLDEATRREDIAQAIIANEYPLLVGLALWGAEELIDAGRFVVPSAIAQQSKEAVAGGNQINDFADLLEFGPYEIATHELYACYVRWCREEGRSRAVMPRKTLLSEVERLAGSRMRTVLQMGKATHYQPQHWLDELSGATSLVYLKLKGMTRVDIMCGVRIRADAFGAAPVGQPIPSSRQRAHLFTDAPALPEAA